MNINNHDKEKKEYEKWILYKYLYGNYSEKKFNEYKKNEIEDIEEASNQDIYLKSKNAIVEITRLDSKNFFNRDLHDMNEMIYNIYKELINLDSELIPIDNICFKEEIKNINSNKREYKILINEIVKFILYFIKNISLFEKYFHLVNKNIYLKNIEKEDILYKSLCSNGINIEFIKTYILAIELSHSKNYCESLLIELNNFLQKKITEEEFDKFIKNKIKEKDFNNFNYYDLDFDLNDSEQQRKFDEFVKIIMDNIEKKIEKGKPSILKEKKYKNSKLWLIIDNDIDNSQCFHNEDISYCLEEKFREKLSLEIKNKIKSLENCFFNKIIIFIAEFIPLEIDV